MFVPESVRILQKDDRFIRGVVVIACGKAMTNRERFEEGRSLVDQ